MNQKARWGALAFLSAAVACSRSNHTEKVHPSAAMVTLQAVEDLSRPDASLSQRLSAARHGFVAHAERFVSEGRSAGDVSVEVSRRELSLVGESPSSRIVLRPEGATAAGYELESGCLVAHEISPGVDEIVTTTARDVESFMLVKTPRTAAVFAWTAELGADITHVAKASDGGLRFEDNVGRARFAITPAFALDSRGSRRAATLEWEPSHSTLRLSLDATGLVFPVLVDPTITNLSWRRVEDPESRMGAVIAYDSGRRRTVFTGGTSAVNGVLSDTWEWDGALWLKRAPASSPPNRQDAAGAYDSVRGRVVLFGGATSTSTALADLWEWNGSTWTEAVAASAPPARSRHGLAFDSARQRSILFGGKAPSGLALGDTWEWNGSAWTERTVTPSPSPRYGHSLTYDEHRQVTVLVGGVLAGGLPAGDIWEWDGVAWKNAPYVPSAFQGGAQVGGGYDAVAKLVRLANAAGASATWDGAVLQAGTGVPPESAAFTFDRDRNVSIAMAAGVTWEEQGGGWKIRTGATPPSGRIYGSTAFDSARGVVVLHGGNTSSNTPAPGTTLEWDGSTWTSKLSPEKPDPIPFQPVLSSAGPLQHVIAQHLETWNWDGLVWKRVPTPLLAPLSGRALVFDSARNRAVLFGGTFNGGPIAPPETWEFEPLGVGGGTWRSVTPLASPPGRYGAGGAYDPVRQRVVMFGGQSLTGPSDETWEYDGITWKRVVTPSAPSARLYPSLAFDAARGKIVLYGGWNANDLWEYDGASWAPRVVAGPAPPHQAPLMSYDGNRFVVFGGSPSAGTDPPMSTWVLEVGYGACASNVDCPNGLFCTDGVCCQSISCNTCETCNGATKGICTSVVSGADSDSCTGSKMCSEKGECRSSIGAKCGAGEECSTGFCVDGVCCDSACTQSTSTCDPAGICRSKLGTTCAKPTDCASEFCVDNVCCESSCRGNSQTCDAKGICRGGPGAVCLTAINCTTGYCVDGVCCDTACDGLCVACKASLKEENARDGECGFAKSGSDLREQCLASDATSCGTDGTCDGRGACRSHQKGTQCGPDVQCITEGAATGQLCDGFGVCGKKDSSIDCAGYRCSVGKGCEPDCKSDAECISTYRCDTGKCVPKEGASCDGDHTVKSPNGTSTDCTPYKCDGTACKSRCASIYECASGFECTAEGKCVIVDYGSQPDGEGCACRAVPRSRNPGSGSVAALAIGVFAAYRRRGRRPFSRARLVSE